MEEQRAEWKATFCKGQEPEQVTAAVYNSLPEVARNYIAHNGNQYLAAGCPPL